MKRTTKSFSVLMLFTLLLTACGGDQITIGTQTYTETKILGYMYEALIEDQTDIDVEVKTDFSASPIVIEAMNGDEVQLATLYTGEIFNGYFSIEDTNDRQRVLEQAQEGFAETYNFKWLDPVGFENTYAFTVRQDVAEQYNLEKITDLKDVANDMRLGVDTTWLERDNDGYNAFTETYGLEFGDTFPMEIGLVYDAVNNEEVDIVLAYSTDPRISEYNLVTLEDDKQFFPPYDASTVIKQEVLDENPEIQNALTVLVGAINEETMRELNARVDIAGEDPQDVALDYLQSEGLLE